MPLHREMGTPEIKSFDCIDQDPIDQWSPGSEADVHYSLCLHIGSVGGEGADRFHVVVVTPQAITEHNLGRTLPKRCIMVSPYSWENVLKEVQARLARCVGDDWNRQSRLLAEHFSWEFEERARHSL
ncbi:Imm8 family immunity protein [Luteolibacter arcticus]|uniref:Imm8 family immunity protein n=1 Tax=Luteolibacter arcticus TaxID=1581411 RepID=UPI0034E0B263